MRKLPLIAAVAAMTTATIAPAAAEAHGRRDRHSHASQYDRGYDNRGYDNRAYNRGYDGRSYGQRQRCRSGTTGAILGAAAGALLGREIAGRGATGTILGAAGGGLAGRELTRDKRCR